MSKFIRDQPKSLRQNRVRIAAHSHQYMYKKPSLGFILERENIGEIIENELNNNHVYLLLQILWFFSSRTTSVGTKLPTSCQ